MSPPSPPTETERWTLIRDLLGFTVKVSIEAVRDLVLIPLVLVVGLAGLLFNRDQPDVLFRAILRIGRRFDEWLNLFGEYDEDPGGGFARAKRAVRAVREPPSPTIDRYFSRLESLLVEQQKKGGITEGARETIDRALDAIQDSIQKTRENKNEVEPSHGE